MRCSHCNMDNPPGSRFCGNCGRPLKADGDQALRESGRAEEKGHRKGPGKGVWIGAICIILVIAAAAVGFLIFGSGKNAKEMDQLLAKGDQYLEELDYEEAEAQYLEAIAVDPKEEEPYLKLAELYTKQNQPGKAAKILEEGKKNTESEAITERYTLYSYVDQALIPKIGACREGEYICGYKHVNGFVGVDGVHDQKGVLTSRIRDFDGDGEEELLVLVLDNEADLDETSLGYVSEGEKVNQMLLQMYELEEEEVILKDEYQGLCPVLGYGDEESSGVFLKEKDGRLYICGSLHQMMRVSYSGGNAVQLFVLIYDGEEFVFQAGQREVTVGTDFEGERESAMETADFLEEIGLPKEAAQIRESYIEKFDFADEMDDVLLRITGEEDGNSDRDAFWDSGGRNLEYLGNVVIRLRMTWEEGESAASQEKATETAGQAPEIYEEGTVEMTGTVEEVEFSHPNGSALTAMVLKLDEPADLKITHDGGPMVYEDCEQIQLGSGEGIDPSWKGKRVKVTGELRESPLTAYYLDTYVIWDPVLEEISE